MWVEVWEGVKRNGGLERMVGRRSVVVVLRSVCGKGDVSVVWGCGG